MDAIKNTLGLNNSFDPNKDIPDLSGKTYVVTGGSAGIGFGICAHLLQHNCAALYLLGKKEEHLSEAEEGLKKYGDTSKVHTIQIELEDLKHTAEVANKLKDELPQLDGLILNAGLGVGPYNVSKDGLDTHMQVNVIAQHHLMMVLLPTLLKTPDSRIALQSSDLHRPAPSDTKFASTSDLNRDIGAMNLYNRSKLAQVLLVRTLHRRKQTFHLGLTPSSAPWINATHPGGVATDQQDQAIEAYGTAGKMGVKAVRPFMKDPVDEGCRPILFAATAREVGVEGIDGAYIVPERKVTEPSKQAQDEALQERLWKLVGEVLREKLGELPYEM